MKNSKNPENELKRRQFLLTGSYIPVLLSVAIPLLSQNSLTIIFQFFDIFTAANMSMNVVKLRRRSQLCAAVCVLVPE